eukprot:3398355-Amphidinium_carterae.2
MAPSNMLKQHPLQQSTTLPGAMAESNWHAHGSGGETGAARQCRHSTCVIQCGKHCAVGVGKNFGYILADGSRQSMGTSGGTGWYACHCTDASTRSHVAQAKNKLSGHTTLDPNPYHISHLSMNPKFDADSKSKQDMMAQKKKKKKECRVAADFVAKQHHLECLLHLIVPVRAAKLGTQATVTDSSSHFKKTACVGSRELSQQARNNSRLFANIHSQFTKNRSPLTYRWPSS